MQNHPTLEKPETSLGAHISFSSSALWPQMWESHLKYHRVGGEGAVLLRPALTIRK